jgi:ribonuclease HII
MKALTQKYEHAVRQRGFVRVVGIDEVGRGAWAGPIVAAGVIFAPDTKIKGLHDSKKLTPEKRAELAEKIKEKALAYSIQMLSNDVIDEEGVGSANARVIEMVIDALEPDFALIDKAHAPNLKVPHEFMIRGDSKVFSIGAASIIAKVYRDQLMVDYDQRYPGYGFGIHKGYGTKMHQESLLKQGHCEIHRTSFQPICQTKLL